MCMQIDIPAIVSCLSLALDAREEGKKRGYLSQVIYFIPLSKVTETLAYSSNKHNLSLNQPTHTAN